MGTPLGVNPVASAFEEVLDFTLNWKDLPTLRTFEGAAAGSAEVAGTMKPMKITSRVVSGVLMRSGLLNIPLILGDSGRGTQVRKWVEKPEAIKLTRARNCWRLQLPDGTGAGATHLDDEWGFIGVIAFDSNLSKKFPCAGGLEGDGEFGAGSRIEIGQFGVFQLITLLFHTTLLSRVSVLLQLTL